MGLIFIFEKVANDELLQAVPSLPWNYIATDLYIYV